MGLRSIPIGRIVTQPARTCLWSETTICVTAAAFPSPLNDLSNNRCFTPGQIQPGIEFLTNDPIGPNQLLFASAGFLGAPSNVVVGNSLVDTYIIRFPNYDANTVCMDVTSLVGGGGPCDIEVFGTASSLGMFQVPCTLAGNFFGFSLNTEIIDQVSIFDTSGGAEGADNIAFGFCEVEVCDPDPRTQGFWYRQCLGVPASDGGIDPGRNGRGPEEPLLTDFAELMACATTELEDLGFFGTSTCEGMDADPPSDKCEQAQKQLTALILNVCSDQLQNVCSVDLSAEGCSSTNVGDLIDEVAGLIQDGDCNTANNCAAAVNEGNAIP